jgi:hypothetical protein
VRSGALEVRRQVLLSFPIDFPESGRRTALKIDKPLVMPAVERPSIIFNKKSGSAPTKIQTLFKLIVSRAAMAGASLLPPCAGDRCLSPALFAMIEPRKHRTASYQLWR